MKTIHRLFLAIALIGALASFAIPTIHADTAPPDVAAEVVADTVADIAPDVATAPEAETKVATPAPADGLTWVQSLIPLVTPLIVAGLRKLVPKIPKAFLPIAAAVFGLVAEIIAGLASGADINVWLGLGLGLAGVGVREAAKQVKAAASAA